MRLRVYINVERQHRKPLNLRAKHAKYPDIRGHVDILVIRLEA